MMVWIFRERLGKEVYVYIDDIFICTQSIEEMEQVLEYVLHVLIRTKMYVSPKKFQPFVTAVDCLGVRIDDEGIGQPQERMQKCNAS